MMGHSAPSWSSQPDRKGGLANNLRWQEKLTLQAAEAQEGDGGRKVPMRSGALHAGKSQQTSAVFGPNQSSSF